MFLSLALNKVSWYHLRHSVSLPVCIACLFLPGTCCMVSNFKFSTFSPWLVAQPWSSVVLHEGSCWYGLEWILGPSRSIRHSLLEEHMNWGAPPSSAHACQQEQHALSFESSSHFAFSLWDFTHITWKPFLILMKVHKMWNLCLLFKYKSIQSLSL